MVDTEFLKKINIICELDVFKSIFFVFKPVFPIFIRNIIEYVIIVVSYHVADIIVEDTTFQQDGFNKTMFFII